MAHYESYQSFQTKKSIDKKNRAKEVSANKTVDEGFVLPREEFLDPDFDIVIETTYKEAKVIFKGEIITVYGMQRNIQISVHVCDGQADGRNPCGSRGTSEGMQSLRGHRDGTGKADSDDGICGRRGHEPLQYQLLRQKSELCRHKKACSRLCRTESTAGRMEWNDPR